MWNVGLILSIIVSGILPYTTLSCPNPSPHITSLSWSKKEAPPLKSHLIIDTLFYDDGIAYDAWAWVNAGNGWGVKFISPTPANLRGILVYFWEESWPTPGGNLACFRIYSDSLGQPHDLLGELDSVEIERGEWNYIDISALNIQIDTFYVFYTQVSDFPNCPGLAIDETNDAPSGSQWALYSGHFFNDDARPGDWMIRAVVDWVPYAHDVGVTAILSPSKEYVEPGSNIPVEFVVFNFGSTEVEIPVYAEILEAGYFDFDTVPLLLPGDSVIIELDPWEVSEEEGDFTLTVYTSLIGDERPSNDTLLMNLRNYHKPGDVIFVIDVGNITGDEECYGIEYDGEYFYITGGNSGYDPNKVYVIDKDSLLICNLDQPSHSVNFGWRDIAFDFIHTGIPSDSFYASFSSNIDIWGVDTDCTLNYWRSFSCQSCAERAIAFSPESEHFYSANFGGQIYEFDKECNIYNFWTIDKAVSGATVEYGDSVPYIWFSAQNLNSYGQFNKLYKFDPTQGEMVDSLEFPLPNGWTSGLAGGVSFYPNFDLNRVLIELVQGEPTDFVAVIFISKTYIPCGDVNGDLNVNTADLSYLANYLFFSGLPPVDSLKADVNGDGSINSADLSYFANFLFFSGPHLNCPE